MLHMFPPHTTFTAHSSHRKQLSPHTSLTAHRSHRTQLSPHTTLTAHNSHCTQISPHVAFINSFFLFSASQFFSFRQTVIVCPCFSVLAGLSGLSVSAMSPGSRPHCQLATLRHLTDCRISTSHWSRCIQRCHAQGLPKCSSAAEAIH